VSGKVGMTTRMEHVLRRLGIVCVAGFLCCGFVSCPDPYTGPVVTDPRTLRVDVRDLLFSPYENDIPVARGLGASRVTVTVTTDAGSFTGNVGPMANDYYGYRKVEVPGVTGALASVAVRVETTKAKDFTTELSDWTITGAYQGWSSFKNIVKFRLDVKTSPEGFEASRLVLEPCPRGGRSVRLFTDVGVTELGSAVTDRGKAGQANASGLVCVEPRWLEHPSGLGLNLYYAVIDEDLPERYGLGSASSSAGYYMSDYWTNEWTATEIMSSGRSVAGKPIRLTPHSSLNLDAANPGGDPGSPFASIRLDFSGKEGKYLVLAAVLRQGELYAPSEVVCIKIK